jgi:sugar O-acyltransferase (sialic acid O-acetyltransferase NeuD family)
MEDIVLSKKKLFIIGAGEFGRELLTWIRNDNNEDKAWEFFAFLDDDPQKINTTVNGAKIMGPISTYACAPDSCYIVGISSIEKRNKIVNRLKMNDEQMITYISESSIIGYNVSIGYGSVICPNVIISNDVEIGQNVVINCATQIGHDSKIESGSSLMANITIGGRCSLNQNVFIGSGATVIPGRNICQDAFIGAGAVVLSNIRSSGTYLGNPAKKYL